MTASKQSQGGTLTLNGGDLQKTLHETYQWRKYGRKLLMMGREDARNM